MRIPEARKVAGQYPHQLSGGMRQRVMIAMELSCHPALLIADEPTTALDATIQAQILNLMKDLQSRFGLTYLFISHNIGVIRHISDRIAVMYLGKVVEMAEKRMLLNAPAHPYTPGRSWRPYPCWTQENGRKRSPSKATCRALSTPLRAAAFTPGAGWLSPNAAPRNLPFRRKKTEGGWPATFAIRKERHTTNA